MTELNENRIDEINEKYTELLRYFNTYTFYDNLLQTRSYVSMDNIHNAILAVGLTMNEPLNHYIIKAKQMAINDFNASNRHYKILVENITKFIGNDFNFDTINDYGFNEIELDLVIELLSGVKAYKSAIPRRQYQKTLETIREKVRSTL